MLTERSHRRTVPITLRDLPEKVRMNGAMKACQHENDPDMKLQIIYAAVCPSATIYWIAAEDAA